MSFLTNAFDSSSIFIYSTVIIGGIYTLFQNYAVTKVKVQAIDIPILSVSESLREGTPLLANHDRPNVRDTNSLNSISEAISLVI